MKFSYVALNQEHKKLTGVISAEDQSEARDKLHAMQLSIITIHEATKEEIDSEKEGVMTFEFHVVDSKGNETRGTIDAKSRKKAFFRLVSEYGFHILSLCDTSVPIVDREEKGKEGLEELADEVEEEFGVVQKSAIDEMTDEGAHKQSEDFLSAKQELVENVEEIVDRANAVLEKFEEKLTGDEYRSIKVKIDSLMRLRLSNNLKYIQDLADELLILVDTALQQHAEISEDDVKEHSFVGVLEKEEIDEEAVHKGVLSHIKKIKSKMKKLVGGYKGKKTRFRKKKKKKNDIDHGMFIRTRLVIRCIKRSIASLKRAILAKNSAVRKQHIKNLISSVKEVHKILKTPKKKLIAVQEDMDQKEQEDEEEIKREQEFRRMRRGVTTQRFFQEVHLFFGWLLAFYVAYFYFSSFVLVKWGSESVFFTFFQKSLGNPFPYIVVGLFFILFLGTTLCLRFSFGRISIVSVYFLITASLAALFLINY
jgi:hypothetical protein